MHILVTNDDGPPSPTSSPYVHSLVRELQRAGHTVSVCLPHAQRSWIGKAHMIGQTVKPLYYRPSATFDPTPAAADKVQGTTHPRPSGAGSGSGSSATAGEAGQGQGQGQVEEEEEEEWVLVDGTPASAAQIGLRHFFRDRGPVDLVVSGPNYGRNSTAVFALSSGTLGGALEAAICRTRAVALSYAFFSRNHDPAVIDGASRHSVRVIARARRTDDVEQEALYEQWPEDRSVDLYTVNVPLVEGVGGRKTLFANMLQNYWGEGGSCFQEVEAETGDGDEEEGRIREDEEAGAGDVGAARGNEKSGGAEHVAQNKRTTHRHFKWAPRFTDVYKSVEESPPGSDGWCVKEGYTSITPLKANFWHSATSLQGSELKLQDSSSQRKGRAMPSESTLAFRPKAHFSALIAYDDAYVQPLILAALRKLFPPEVYTLLLPPRRSPGEEEEEEEEEEEAAEISLGRLLPGGDDSRVLQVTPYEAVDWGFVAAHPDTCLVNSYMLRKALIRKHYLSATVDRWVSKRPGSALRDHVRRGEAFEVDYAEFLDDALVEAFDLRASLERNRRILGGDEQWGGGGGGERTDGDGPGVVEWWILKPSMSDRGQGIRLFSTMDELQAIFDEWEEGQPGSDEEDDEDGDGDADGSVGDRDYIVASHLRHFVAQPYIHPPLLLPGDGRKFHIRTYVLCVGSLDVYVYRPMLALFAGKAYAAPRSASSSSAIDLEAHLTNTCRQRSVADGTVRPFWELGGMDDGRKRDVFAQVCEVTGELFEAAARGMPMHFRPLPNAFEVFGLDFLVDAAGRAWLLEANAFPDFAQTGAELRGLVAGLWEAVLRRAVVPFFSPSSSSSSSSSSSAPPCFSPAGAAGAAGGHKDRPAAGDEAHEAHDGMVHVRHVDLLATR